MFFKTIALAAVSAVLLGGCPADPEAPLIQFQLPAEYEPVDGCVQDSIDTMMDALGGSAAIARLLQDPAAAGATATADPLLWNWAAGDFDGSATYSADPAGGMAVGDTVVVDWNHAVMSGTGMWTIERTAENTYTVFGASEYDDGTCALGFEFTEADPLVVTLGSALAQSTEPTVEAPPTQIRIEFDGHVLTADVSWVDGVLTFENVMLDGEPVPDINLALLIVVPPPPGVVPPAGANQWVGTWRIDYSCTGIFTGSGSTEAVIDYNSATGVYSGTESEVGLTFQLINIRAPSANTLTVETLYNDLEGVDVIEVQEFIYDPGTDTFTKTSNVWPVSLPVANRNATNTRFTCTGNGTRTS